MTRAFFITTLAFVFQATAVIAGTFDSLVGSYPVLMENGKSASGFLTVVSDATNAGIQLKGLSFTSTSVTEESILSEVGSTQLQDLGNGVYLQTSAAGARNLQIQYTVGDGIITVASKDCDVVMGCVENAYVVSSGKSLGVAVDTHSFFEERKGDWRLLKVVNHVPEAGKDKGFVEVDSTYYLVSFQYCTPTTCDPVYLVWDPAAVSVYKRSEGAVDFYDILVKTDAGIEYFRWEQPPTGAIRFQNFQYVDLSSNVQTGLEHEIEKW